MFAHAFLTVIRSKKTALQPGDGELIRLSLPEIRRLLVWRQALHPDRILGHLIWRRKHQQMPDTVELAASRLRSLTVSQFVDRLDKRFQLLTGGDRAALRPQQTLRALIDWSYDLCARKRKTPVDQAGWEWQPISGSPAGGMTCTETFGPYMLAPS